MITIVPLDLERNNDDTDKSVAGYAQRQNADGIIITAYDSLMINKFGNHHFAVIFQTSRQIPGICRTKRLIHFETP